MSKIRLLSEQVASQVAAGEVIERPASVVKELVENSLDAGASHVEVHFSGNGARSIRVIDDGCGMSKEDALLCLERHATSKIRSGDDLARIATLGFRGEAIPSIASVSRFRIRTREADAVEGTEVLINGGKMEAVRACGCPVGTEIEARALFFNMPARKKFLRTPATESSHIEQQMLLQALGHPQVGFTLVKNGEIAMQVPPARDLLVRVRDLAGRQLAEQLIPIDMESAGIHLTGYIGKAGVGRSNRQSQLLFVNGRPVDNVTIGKALREGYHTALMKGQYPVTYLFIEMDPEAVDVNVHPAKREVRFHSPRTVQEVVVRAVRQALEDSRPEWTATFQAASTEPPRPHPEPAQQSELLPEKEQTTLRHDWWEKDGVSEFQRPEGRSFGGAEFQKPEPQSTTPPARNSETPKLRNSETPPAETPKLGNAETPKFRILGILGKLYVLMENERGLVIVDQHAAHERILFEELRRRISSEAVGSQKLLLPVTVELPPREADWVAEHLPELQRLGLLLEPFGTYTYKIDALPPFVKVDDPAHFLSNVIEDLQGGAREANRARLGEDVIAKTVCRHAVKANDVLRGPEVTKLIEDLLACELPYCCPHGRPTMIPLAYSEIEKRFGRIAP